MKLRYRAAVWSGIGLLATMSAVGQAPLLGDGEAALSFGPVNMSRDPSATPDRVLGVLGDRNLQTLSTPGVTGVDYYLQIEDGGSGYFHIVDRHIDPNSTLRDPNKSDSELESALPEPKSLLAPRNGQMVNPDGINLGATANGLDYVGSFLSYELARFTLGISPSTPPGSYRLETTTGGSAIGWSSTGSGDHPFVGHGLVTINVPEPAHAVVTASLGVLAFVVSRRCAR
jgi:hypothetical protein